jgi:hypothetical protein
MLPSMPALWKTPTSTNTNIEDTLMQPLPLQQETRKKKIKGALQSTPADTTSNVDKQQRQGHINTATTASARDVNKGAVATINTSVEFTAAARDVGEFHCWHGNATTAATCIR